MGTLTTTKATMHFKLQSVLFETPKLVNVVHCASVSHLPFGNGACSSVRNAVYGETLFSARQLFSLRDNACRVFTMPRNLVNKANEREELDTEGDEVRNFQSYLFHIESGGLVKVSVGDISSKYVVLIEVSSISPDIRSLSLNWRVSNLSIDVEGLTAGSMGKPKEKAFRQLSSGNFRLALEFNAYDAPFSLSFLLHGSNNAVIRSHRKTSFCVPVGFSRGSPSPLGLSIKKEGSVNFSLFSKYADSVSLCLYDDSGADKPALEIGLDPYVNRSGNIWHASLKVGTSYSSYCYRCKSAGNTSGTGHFVSDPYSKVVRKSGSLLLGQFSKVPFFDWSGDILLNLPKEKLVVYRLNVRQFTVDKSSQLPPGIAGYFSGLSEKVNHFKTLGVNAVLLEPLFSFNEEEGPYFPRHFFSPSDLYEPLGQSMSAINAMKEMVKTFHKNGIEVLMEVVFTHTPKSGSLQEIDKSYYLKNGDETTNSLNCNYPVTQQLIIDSLRHWVTDFHIDGFCFINASSLMKGVHGEILSRPPLVESIAFDPLLSGTKIIADGWNSCDVLCDDVRFPHWKRWAEVNSRFCKDIRNFLRGEGLLSDLATRLCGSGDKFSGGRGPSFSFNFISRNSGLSLVDLVSFSNDEAHASELSWNCGYEGPTTKTAILERRLKQIRNYLFILFVSLGVPVLNMGDECGQSTGGSILYSERKPLNWNSLKTSYGIQITQFIFFLSSLRIRRSDLLQPKEFLKVENIDWRGRDESSPKWDYPTSKLLAVTLRADEEATELGAEVSSAKGDLFLVFNTADHSESVILPPPPTGMEWLRLVDTALPFPGFFSLMGEPVLEELPGVVSYEMKSYSCALFEARCTSE